MREVGKHQPRHDGRERHDPRALAVAAPVDRRRGPGDGRWLRPLPLPGDDVDVDVAAPAHQLVHDRAEDQFTPARARRFPEDDAGDVPPARVRQHLGGDVVPGQRGGLGAELLGQAEGLDDAVLVRRRESGIRWRLNAHHDPLGPETGRHPPRGTDDPGGQRARADADQDPLGHRPDARNGVVAAVDLHLGVHPGRGRPERQLAEGDQVALAEEALDGFPRLLRHVHLPVSQPLDQLVGRQIDQLDLVGRLDHRVRDRLPRRHAGHARDDVVQALEVLHVQRRVDVDAGGEQLGHVLPALGVARAGGVRVGQLVDQNQGRATGEGGVEIELAQAGAAVLDGPRRQSFEAREECLRLRPAVRLDPTNHHVDAGRGAGVGGFQHGVRLSDAGGGAKENLQLAARLALLVGPDALQQLIGIRPFLAHRLVPRLPTPP